MENTKSRYLIVVRHGQRKDHRLDIYPEYKGHPDAPLTPLGYDQARETGKFFKSYIQSLKD